MANVRDWTVDVDAAPPPSADPRKAVLSYDVIIRDVIPDVAVAAVDQDWEGGVLPRKPRLLGKLEEDDRTIAIDGARGTGLSALAQMIEMGVWHILEGADHIAFLLTLLLTVKLTAHQRHWIVERANGKVLSKTVWRVSAFTAGHTLSLLATSQTVLATLGFNIGIELVQLGIVAVTLLLGLRGTKAEPLVRRTIAAAALLAAIWWAARRMLGE